MYLIIFQKYKSVSLAENSLTEEVLLVKQADGHCQEDTPQHT